MRATAVGEGPPRISPHCAGGRTHPYQNALPIAHSHRAHAGGVDEGEGRVEGTGGGGKLGPRWKGEASG
jgi:hypothetical protein